MRQKLTIFAVLAILIFVLIGLNVASYTQKEKTPDSESSPNRSSFNAGSTGTQAFYALLSETGHKVTRWQQPISELSPGKKNSPATLVIIGSTRREISKADADKILEWVNGGGRLVLIDREPAEEFNTADHSWKFTFQADQNPRMSSIDPTSARDMTVDVNAARPVQPTVFTNNINAIQPSRFSASINFTKNTQEFGKYTIKGTGDDDSEYHVFNAPPPLPKPVASPNAAVDKELPPPPVRTADNTFSGMTSADIAPVLHAASDTKNILADITYGRGKIVFLADPYIVSNSGISLVDNAQLAINIVSAGDGIIAFDEYHQGYGSNNNRLFEFFAGTPVVAIFLQLAVVAGFILFSQSRRFGRAVPADESNRLSKLEYISAMAELQQRTKAFDLAIESIYKDFRRRSARLFGVDNTTISRKDLAAMIAERIKADVAEIDRVMFKCEDIMHGEPTNRKETLNLMIRLRQIENDLGLKRVRAAGV